MAAGVALMMSPNSPKRSTGGGSDHSPNAAANREIKRAPLKISDSDQDRKIPAFSGDAYHALEFIRNPNRDLGHLVELDPWSFPMLSRGFVAYQRLDRKSATTSGRIGLRFDRALSDDTLLYDVMLNDLQGDFLQGTDFVTAGQIAVQMSKPGLVPDTLQTWDVEPLGTIEGTTVVGLVIRIPLVRFWRYHESHLDASEPIRVEVPPQKYKNGWAVANSGKQI